MTVSFPLIQLEHICAAYDRKPVLEDINLTVCEQDFIGIIGPNGGGKTTLVKLILGLLHPLSGSIRFYQNGKETSELSMGYLPQYTSIDKKFPISVYDVILSGLNKQKSLFRSFTKAQHEKVRAMLSRVGLEGLEQRPIGQDEPNTYIDKRFETHLYTLLEEINREHAIILVSHDINTVLQHAQNIACVNHTLDYLPIKEVTGKWIEEHFDR